MNITGDFLVFDAQPSRLRIPAAALNLRAAVLPVVKDRVFARPIIKLRNIIRIMCRPNLIAGSIELVPVKIIGIKARIRVNARPIAAGKHAITKGDGVLRHLRLIERAVSDCHGQSAVGIARIKLIIHKNRQGDVGAVFFNPRKTKIRFFHRFRGVQRLGKHIKADVHTRLHGVFDVFIKARILADNAGGGIAMPAAQNHILHTLCFELIEIDLALKFGNVEHGLHFGVGIFPVMGKCFPFEWANGRET